MLACRVQLRGSLAGSAFICVIADLYAARIG
jgi:hypothetical protein